MAPPPKKCLAHVFGPKNVWPTERKHVCTGTPRPTPPPASFGRPTPWTKKTGAAQTFRGPNIRSNLALECLYGSTTQRGGDDVCTSPLLGFHVIPPRFCSLRAPRMFVRVDFGQMFVRVSLFGSARPARPKHPSGETTISGPFPCPFAEEPRAVSLLRMFVPRHFVQLWGQKCLDREIREI